MLQLSSTTEIPVFTTWNPLVYIRNGKSLLGYQVETSITRTSRVNPPENASHWNLSSHIEWCATKSRVPVAYFGPLLSLQARRYDSRTTIFSPEGRLYQVEYAMEAISHAGTCLGILAKDGILLAAERRNTNKLLDEGVFAEKIYKLNEWVE